jgi:hypothetical protein
MKVPEQSGTLNFVLLPEALRVIAFQRKLEKGEDSCNSSFE